MGVPQSSPDVKLLTYVFPAHNRPPGDANELPMLPSMPISITGARFFHGIDLELRYMNGFFPVVPCSAIIRVTAWAWDIDDNLLEWKQVHISNTSQIGVGNSLVGKNNIRYQGRILLPDDTFKISLKCAKYGTTNAPILRGKATWVYS